MILVIAERVHSPSMPAAKVAEWAELWRKAPMRCMHIVKAMTHGSTRKRLEHLLCSPPNRVMNLLPPDSRCGSWNAAQARDVAQQFRKWLYEGRDPEITSECGQHGEVKTLVLCGSRVMDAWFSGAPPQKFLEIGRSWRYRGISHMFMPHPSGRNRVWNDPENVLKMREGAMRVHLGVCDLEEIGA